MHTMWYCWCYSLLNIYTTDRMNSLMLMFLWLTARTMPIENKIYLNVSYLRAYTICIDGEMISAGFGQNLGEVDDGPNST